MKTKQNKGKTFGVCVAALAFLLMAAGSGTNSGDTASKIGEVSSKSAEESSNNDESSSSKEESSKDDSSSSKASDDSSSKSDAPEKKSEYHVGDIIQTDDLKIVYTASGDYHTDNEFLQPDAGKKYIFIELYCENISKSDTSISSFSFECYADGYSCDGAYLSENELSATLSPGRSTSGRVYFTVPENSSEIQIEYEVNVWTEEKAIFAFDGNADSGFVPENNTEATADAFKVGDIITTQNLIITYLSSGEYTSDNMFMTPKDGYHYIYCEFEFENISDSDEHVSSYDFDCFADGSSCDGFFGMDDNLSATLSPKRKAKGTVAFEVPINAENVEVEFLTNYWTSDRIVFTYK